MKNDFYIKMSNVLMIITVCVLCIRPIVTNVHSAPNTQNSYSLIAITLNHGVR